MLKMQVMITAPGGYRCAPEGHTVVTIPYGEVVTGQVAAWALKDHTAKRQKKSSRKLVAARKKGDVK